ncbi:hypothetical protein [uncultured Desulfovibrio sp.]|uniref:hypothetical protein n=1 Tax=uncultured Desulfovibrio sp. TaxID=167968 RepID=UPI002617DB71|nr:hypothetical protein [uncultured Desulfovibrio sp.]
METLCTATGPSRPAVRTAPGKTGSRKLAMRVMLGALAASVALGFAGNKTAHVLTGAVFGVLLADHVWKRRKAL